MRIDQALAIASKARIRRRIAAPSDVTTEQISASPERPVDSRDVRDAKGRFVKGWRGGPGRPRHDSLRALYVGDLYHVWRRHGRAVIRQLAEENPAIYLRIMAGLVKKMSGERGD